jgi:lysophospholipase L1-like esterase
MAGIPAIAQEEWGYAALGDSLATGYLASAGYVPRYQTHIQTDNGVPVTLYNLGQNGAISGNLLNSLRSNAVFTSALSDATVVTWNIGLNDIKNARQTYKNKRCKGADNQDCLRNVVSTFKQNWDQILMEIGNRSRPGAKLRTVDIYNPWVRVDKTSNTFADSKELGPARGNDLEIIRYYLSEMNTHIAQSATSFNIPVASAYAAFNGAAGDEDAFAKGYLASDNLHPTNGGHQLIADLLRALGY